MKTIKKKVLVLGLLTLFAAANVVVAVSNERHKSLFVQEDAEATDWVGLGLLVYQIWEHFNQYNNTPVFKHYEENKVTCTDLNVLNGVYACGSEAARMLDSQFNLHGEESTAVGNVKGEAHVQFKATRFRKTNTSFGYNIIVQLPGEWSFFGCKQCPENDPEMLGKNCVPYDPCSQISSNRVSDFRSALGISNL